MIKKAIYIFLFLFLTVYIVWALNLFGILQLDDVVTSTPYIKERMKTDKQYDRMMNDYYKLENAYDELKTANDELKSELQQVKNTIEQKNEKIKNLENRYSELKQSQEEEKNRIEKLVKIYENMDPEEAANVITDLRMETTLAIVNELKDEHLAEILMNMPQDKAVQLTERLRE